MLADRAVLILVYNEPRIARRQNVAYVSGSQELGRSDTDVRVVGLGCRQIENFGIVGASRRERRDQPHGPSVDRRQPVGFRRNTGAVKPPAQGNDPGIGMRQHQDRLFFRVAGQSVGNQLCFSAPGRRGHCAAVDRQKVDVIRRHCWPKRKCRR